jgi:hypothetical protein
VRGRPADAAPPITATVPSFPPRPCSDQLLRNAQKGVFHLEIDLEHIKNDRETLHDVITKHPGEYIGMMELGAREFLLKSRQELRAHNVLLTEADVPPVQITFTGQLPLTPIRHITVRPSGCGARGLRDEQPCPHAPLLSLLSHPCSPTRRPRR